MIADGMGGHNAGEVAARLAVDAVVDLVMRQSPTTHHPFGSDPALSADGNLLRTAIHLANAQIRETAFTSIDYAGMGTTIVAARVARRPPVGGARRRQPAVSVRASGGCGR